MANPQIENGHVDIANEIMDALAKTRIPGEARQVLDFILRKTYGWHKKEDAISLSQFVEGTGLSKPHVCMAVQKLVCMNLIVKNCNVTENGNDAFTEKGNDSTTYGFQKDFEEWKPLPKKVTLPKKVKGHYRKRDIQKKTITKESSRRRPKTVEEFVEEIKKSSAYSHVNVDHELEKMRIWLLKPENSKRKMTSGFIVNWLNKIECPMVVDQPYNPYAHLEKC